MAKSKLNKKKQPSISKVPFGKDIFEVFIIWVYKKCKENDCSIKELSEKYKAEGYGNK